MIELGVAVKDKITGFRGIVTGRAQYITGCDQYLVTPHADEKGDLKDGRWFDEQRLDVLDGDPIILDNSKGTGADLPAPIK
ncbi:MAG TPA: hypothetical protein VF406_04540 [Thermodesulfobacteriota bacterium]